MQCGTQFSKKNASTFGTLTSTYVTSASNGTDLTTYSFASTSLGGTNSNDVIVVCAGGEGITAPGPLTTVSSLSVAGVGSTTFNYVSNATQSYTIP